MLHQDYKPSRLPPNHPIAGLENLTVGDFWSWAYSDALNNVNRALLAEFLVAAALDLLGELRVAWNAVDLYYRDAAGTARGIEVKSAAYLQSWPQSQYSAISFGIGKTRGWDAETGNSTTEPLRSAACYVFCLYPEKDPAKVNVLDYSSSVSGAGRVHILGDASATTQPKAGHIANQEAKVCADALSRIFAGGQPDPAPVTNSACFSTITMSQASWLHALFQYDAATASMKPVAAAGAASVGWNGDHFEDMGQWFKALMADTFA